MKNCELKVSDLSHIYFWTKGIYSNIVLLRDVCEDFGLVYDPTMTGKQQFYGWSNSGTEIGQTQTPQVFCTTEYSLRQHFERATGKNKHRTNFSVHIATEAEWINYMAICDQYGFDYKKNVVYGYYMGVQHSQHKRSIDPFGMTFTSIGRFHAYCTKYFSPLDREAYPYVPPEPKTLSMLFSSHVVEISDSKEFALYKKFCERHSLPWSKHWRTNSMRWYGSIGGTAYSNNVPPQKVTYKFRSFSELEDMTHTVMETMDIVNLCYMAETKADAQYYFKQARHHHIPFDPHWSGFEFTYYGVKDYEAKALDVDGPEDAWCQYYDIDTIKPFFKDLYNPKPKNNDKKRTVNTEPTTTGGSRYSLPVRARQHSASSRCTGNSQSIGRIRARIKTSSVSASAIKL